MHAMDNDIKTIAGSSELPATSTDPEAALFAMAFTAFLVKYVSLRKRHELIVAIIYGLAAVAFLVLWILQLAGVMAR